MSKEYSNKELSQKLDDFAERLTKFEKALSSLSSKLNTVDNAVYKLEKGGVAAPATPKADNQIVLREQIRGEITKVIDNEIRPEIAALRRTVHMNSDYGAEELVSGFQRELLHTYDGPANNQRRIAGAPTTGDALRRGEFLFGDD